MKKQNGFTLIELVIVIIVLGILAATAVPKFINLQDDARASVVKGAEAAIRSGANLVYSKSAIAGDENSDAASVAIGTDVVLTKFGYPKAGTLQLALELDPAFTVSGAAPTSADDAIILVLDGSECSLTYNSATAKGGLYSLVNSCD